MAKNLPLVQLVIRVPSDLRRRAKIHCAMREITLTQFVTEAISEGLEEEDEDERPARRAASR